MKRNAADREVNSSAYFQMSRKFVDLITTIIIADNCFRCSTCRQEPHWVNNAMPTYCPSLQTLFNVYYCEIWIDQRTNYSLMF